MRVRGKGIKDGDLYVEAKVIAPMPADDRSKELIEEFDKLNPQNPRTGPGNVPHHTVQAGIAVVNDDASAQKAAVTNSVSPFTHGALGDGTIRIYHDCFPADRRMLRKGLISRQQLR